MAKRVPRQPQAGPLPAAVSRAIDSIRRPFTQFVTGFTSLSTRRAELAPELMKAFAKWQAAAGGNFVGFVRVLDPTVPADRDGYRNHKAYQAAEYLRRLVGRTDTATRTQPVRSNLTALARMLATVLPLVRDVEVVWSAVEAEFGLQPRQLSRLRQVTGTVQPLLRLAHVRPQAAAVVHMEAPIARPQAAAA